MPAITRRQCICACPSGEPPDGEGLPTCSCTACPNSPCSFYVDFGCYVICDGLAGGSLSIGEGLLSGKKVSQIYRGECLFEDHCVYRTMRLDPNPSIVCSPLPIAGNPVYFCGEGNKYGIDCGCDSVGCDSWLDCVTGPPTWRLEYTSTSAELVGTTDSGETVTYQTRDSDPWVCPEPGVESVNRLWMVDYPDGMTDCDKFPKMVCVYPAEYDFQTYCTDKEDVCNCCDAGWEKVAVTLNTPDCDFDGECVTLTRNATLPGFITDPNGACGYLYGTFGVDTDCNGSLDTTMHYLTWCDGTNWKVQLYCGETLVCDETATMTECCPEGAVTSFTCADFGDCCPTCPPTGIDTGCCDDLIPTTLYATLAAASCATLDGTVITLTYTGASGGVYYWSGTFTPSSPGTCSTPFTFNFAIVDGVSCEYYMWIDDSGGNLLWGCDTDCDMGSLSCPFASAANLLSNTPIPTCIISIFSPLCSGIMTATVTP